MVREESVVRGESIWGCVESTRAGSMRAWSARPLCSMRERESLSPYFCRTTNLYFPKLVFSHIMVPIFRTYESAEQSAYCESPYSYNKVHKSFVQVGH